MRSLGFFCFSLSLALALSAFLLADAASAIKEKTTEAKTAAFAVEQAGLKRFEIEQNADKAIQFAIEKSIREGKDSTAELKQSADSALLEVFEKETGASFFSANATPEQYAQLAFLKGEALEKKEIEENSKVLTLSMQGTAFLVEYSITGGLQKNKVVFAVIENAAAKQVFILPIGYSNKILVAK